MLHLDIQAQVSRSGYKFVLHQVDNYVQELYILVSVSLYIA